LYKDRNAAALVIYRNIKDLSIIAIYKQHAANSPGLNCLAPTQYSNPFNDLLK